MSERNCHLWFRLALAGLLLAAVALLIPPKAARAGYILDIYQSGSNVIAKGWGTINLNGLETPQLVDEQFNGSIEFDSNGDIISTGLPTTPPSNAGLYAWTASSVAALPTNGFSYPNLSEDKAASGGSGPRFSVQLPSSIGLSSGFTVTIPQGAYTGVTSYPQPGFSISTFKPTSPTGTLTLADLGLTAGTSCTWSWGTGTTDGSYTIEVTDKPVPEPNTAALFLVGLGLICLIGLRRKFKGQTHIA